MAWISLSASRLRIRGWRPVHVGGRPHHVVFEAACGLPARRASALHRASLTPTAALAAKHGESGEHVSHPAHGLAVEVPGAQVGGRAGGGAGERRRYPQGDAPRQSRPAGRGCGTPPNVACAVPGFRLAERRVSRQAVPSGSDTRDRVTPPPARFVEEQTWSHLAAIHPDGGAGAVNGNRSRRPRVDNPMSCPARGGWGTWLAPSTKIVVNRRIASRERPAPSGPGRCCRALSGKSGLAQVGVVELPAPPRRRGPGWPAPPRVRGGVPGRLAAVPERARLTCQQHNKQRETTRRPSAPRLRLPQGDSVPWPRVQRSRTWSRADTLSVATERGSAVRRAPPSASRRQRPGPMR